MTYFYSGMKGPVAIDKLNQLWQVAGDIEENIAALELAATTASNAAQAASTSETNAATSETNAATSASLVESILDAFEDKYLGQKVQAPTVDNDGNSLVIGALYFNSTDNTMYVRASSTWEQVSNTQSQVSAALQAQQAEISNIQALAYKNKAQQWADAGTNVEVESGRYSAKHWATEAQATATGALKYRGTWQASSGAYPISPSLGDYYKVQTQGVVATISYNINDSIVYNGSSWDHIDSTDQVTSIAGKTGAVNLSKSDVGLENVDNTSDNTKNQAAVTLTNKTITTPSIDGSGINFTGLAQRITADFSNGTVANRLMFQTSTANGHTVIHAVPNGTSQSATFSAESSSTDPANGYAGQLQCDGTKVNLSATARGAVAGTPIPMAFFTNNTERMRIDTSGNVGIGVTDPAAKLDVRNSDIRLSTNSARSTPYRITRTDTGSVNGLAAISMFGSGASGYLGNITLSTASTDFFDAPMVERMRIDSGGTTTFVSGAFGYGAGAGITPSQQTTHKGTAVVADKPSGLITTHAATLNANSKIAFIVTNSFVTAADTVSLNVVGGTGDVTAYLAYAFPYAGGFYITLWNTSASNLGDAVQIKFNVIKGSNT